MATNPRVRIRACTEWGYEGEAARLAEQLLTEFGTDLEEVVIVPGIAGVFDVSINGTLVFSMEREERFPELDDIKPKVKALMG